MLQLGGGTSVNVAMIVEKCGYGKMIYMNPDSHVKMWYVGTLVVCLVNLPMITEIEAQWKDKDYHG